MRRGAKKVSEFNFVHNYHSVITFFKQIGFEQSQIRNAIFRNPLILSCNVDKTLIPKTELFQKLGFSESDIAKVIEVNPSICLMGLNTNIIPAIQALKEIMGCYNHVISILKISPRMRLSCIPKLFLPNVDLLRNYGIPIELIRKHILRNLFSFLRKTDFFQNAVISVEGKLGIPRHSPRFLLGVVLLTSFREKTIESKRRVFKSFGWTDSDIVTLSISTPFVLALSEAMIEKKLDFLMNEMGYEPNYLAKRCMMITSSLEKRVLPRHKLLLVLKEKGLLRMDYLLYSALSMTESQFLKRFVLPYKEVHEVYSKYAGISLEMLTLGSSKPKSNVACC